MTGYKPKLINTVPLILLIPTYSTSQGVQKKTFPTLANGIQIFGSFKTYGGTERTFDGIWTIEDTAIVETWYRPDIKSDCRIAVAQSGAEYDIINEPENIDQRCQYLRFKVKRVKGGA